MPGTGLILNGKRIVVPGLDVTNWLDDSRFRLSKEDVRHRSSGWIRQVVLHATKGIPGGGDHRPQVIRPGFGPHVGAAERCARSWTGSSTVGGAHLVVDFDGQIIQFADLITEAAQHAGHANQTSIGIEIYQGGDAEMYEGQLEVVVRLVDACTGLLGIQRFIPHRYLGPSQRLMASMEDVVGVVGHRDITNRRGAGDPGSKIFYMLGAAGYPDVDYDRAEDREIVRRRQRELGIPHPDGIAGPQTVRVLREAKSIPYMKGTRPLGLWTQRDIDPLLVGLMDGV